MSTKLSPAELTKLKRKQEEEREREVATGTPTPTTTTILPQRIEDPEALIQKSLGHLLFESFWKGGLER